MKYLKLFEGFDKSKIDEICKKYNIIYYTVNPDGSIDRLNDFLETIGKDPVEKVDKYKNIF